MRRARQIKHLLVFLALFILGGILSFVQETNSEDRLPLKVSTSVDKDKVTIGDKITYTITVQAEKNIEVKFPEFAKNLGDFAIKDFGSSERGWFKTKTYRYFYVLDTYVSGKYTIPKSYIKYRRAGEKKWHKVATNEISIEVKSVLESAEDKRNIREIFGPIDFPLQIPWYVWVLLGFAVAGAGIGFFLFKQKKPKSTFIPPLPAHEIAYAALQELKRKKYLSRGEYKLYYIELSDIVRRYLENRFNLRAPEMTTEEFLNSVKNNKILSSEQKNLLREFLSHCDLVKFAKYEPAEKEAELSFESAKKLVDQTKEQSAEGIEHSAKSIEHSVI